MQMRKAITLSCGVGLLGMLFATYANAGCSSYQPKAALSFWEQPQSEARLMPVGLQLVGNHDDAAIVGTVEIYLHGGRQWNCRTARRHADRSRVRPVA